MRKLGVHLMVWNGQVTQAELNRLPAIREMGYDGVEVPIFNLEPFDVATVWATIEGAGLACTTSTALPAGLSLIDADARAEAVRWLAGVIRITADLGASLLCGPMAVPVGELRGRGFTPAEWNSAVIAFREVGQIAADHGVTLALEPLNRFETFFLNTATDAVRLMAEVDSPSVGLLLDTFHMHIEEKSTPAAIRLAAPYLKHFHCSENDRGTVGSGQVAWSTVFPALDSFGYDGWLVVESFGAAIPELAAATCVWRPLASSPEALAEGSLRYIRSKVSPHTP